MKSYLAKADLHLHSKASNLPGGWLSQILNCPESFTEPQEIYKRLKERGMTYITITDHNTIDGVLEIAHLPEVFISCEYTVLFPEEKAKVHVLVYGIDEQMHQDLIKLRENVYEFVKYLKEKDIAHSLAHPLYPVQDTRITKSLVEKFVLLFDNWEIINGTRGEGLKTIEEKLARLYDGWEKIRKLEEKYNIQSLRSREHIAFTAGSDDHGGLDLGRTWTEANASSKEEFLKAIKEGHTFVGTEELGYERVLNMVGRVAYDYLNRHNTIPKHVRPFLDFVFMHSDNLFSELFVRNLFGTNAPRHYIFKEIINKLPFMSLERLIKEFSPTHLGETILSFILHFLPLIILSQQKKEEDNAKKLVKNLGLNNDKPTRLAYITDTYFEINGVARSSKIVRNLASTHNLPVDVITVGNEQNREDNLVLLKPMMEFSTPFYEEFKLRVPSLVELLDLLKEYSHIHVATPGPAGIMSILIAKLLNLPLTFAFHTDVPSYAYKYTNSADLRDWLYRAFAFICQLADRVFVPSETYLRTLVERGVSADKIKIFKRGVDTELFSPSYREKDFFQKNFRIPTKGNVVLYVGRVSKEKNLDTFLYCAKAFPEDTFIVVGDGPYRKELEERKPKNTYFVGYLTGLNLAKAYASADVFLFPSETETYGQVVLEAMASGLPVVVSSKGASHEHVQDGINGFIANSLEDFINKLNRILSNTYLREFMSREALSYARSMDLKESYLNYIDSILSFSRVRA
ncbi:glycosyltransferase [Thermocrinis sp.]